MTDICAVMNVHKEGELARSSLRSIVDCRTVAEAHGISVDIMIVADCADEATRAFAHAAASVGARTVETTVDDLGLARNVGVAAAESSFVAFLDGDDLWSENWLVAAYAEARREPRAAVWHPEANLYFGGGEPYWMVHRDMDDDVDDWTRIALGNPWTSLAFAAHDVFVQTPYRRTELHAQFGYEDWAWNAETVANDVVHKVVPGTVHMLRRRSQSLVERTGRAKALMTPTILFRRRLAERDAAGAGP